MPAQIPIIRIFISSPGDVNDERKIALDVVEQFPYRPVFREKVAFRVVAWDKPGADTAMRATLTPQEAINQGLPKPSECDIVIVLLWSRMGTPFKDTDQKEYLSGTHWELLDGLDSERTETLIYRRTEKKLFDIDEIDKQDQYRRVKDFFQSNLFYRDDGSILRGVNQYETPEDFRRAFTTHLEELIVKFLGGIDNNIITPAEERTPSKVDGQNVREIQSVEWDSDKSPFPGLRSFKENDASIFFGRGRETDALIKQVAESPFVAVVGASGSGKSSLVGAGLIPRLRDRAIEGGHTWDIVSFTPGEHVFKSLAGALMEEIPSLEAQSDRTFARELDEFAEDLEAGIDRLRNTFHRILKDAPEYKKIVLFIDQFEELFTLTSPPLREKFVATLADVLAQGRVQVVVTLRADFYHRAMDYAELAELLNDGNFNLIAPRRDALRDMIERPADRAGLNVETGLVDTILDDTGDEPGNLALMAYLLDELYRICKGDGELTREAYDKLGGVQGAIGERAETVFNKIKGEEADKTHAIHSIFMELVDVDDKGNATRRRFTYTPDDEPELVQMIVTELVDARLLTRSQDVLEVAHEALLREWELLDVWIKREQDNLRLRRRILENAIDWEHNSRSPDLLYRGGILEEALNFLDQNPRIDPLAIEFIDNAKEAEAERIRLAQEQEVRIHQLEHATEESKKQADIARQQEEIAKQQVEIAQIASQKSGKRTRIALIATAIAVIIGVISGGLAFTAQQAQQDAIAQADLASTSEAQAVLTQQGAVAQVQDVKTQVARSEVRLTEVAVAVAQGEDTIYSLDLIEKAKEVYNAGDTVLGLSLALAANRVDNLPITSQRVLGELAYSPGLRRKLDEERGNRVTSVAFSPDGHTALSGSCEQSDHFDCTQGELIYWDIAKGNIIRRFKGHDNGVKSVAFSPDGQTALSGSCEQSDNSDCTQGEMIHWDVATGNIIQHIARNEGAVLGVTFSPDGRMALSYTGGTVILWDVATGNSIQQFQKIIDRYYVRTIAFSPDGETILTGSIRELLLWDVKTGEIIRSFEKDGDLTWTNSVAFSPDGGTILSGGCADYFDHCVQGEMIHWRVASGDIMNRFTGHDSDVRFVAFRPDGQTAISGSDDGTLILWDARFFRFNGTVIQRFQDNKSGKMSTAAVSLNGQSILSAYETGTLLLWDVGMGNIIQRFESPSTSVVFSPDNQSILYRSDRNTLTLRDVTTDDIIQRFEAQGRRVNFAFGSDGQTILSGGLDGMILWDIATGNIIQRFGSTNNLEGVRSLDFSLDEQTIISGNCTVGSEGGCIRHEMILWDVTTGNIIQNFGELSGELLSTAFSPDAQTVLSLSNYSYDNRSNYGSSNIDSKTGNVILWDTMSGEVIRRFESQTQQFTSVVFSPDGQSILTGSWGGILKLWDIMTGAIIQTFRGRSTISESVAFSPDGQSILSGSRDGTLDLWDVATGKIVYSFNDHVNISLASSSFDPMTVTFSPDGDMVALASNTEIILWKIHDARELVQWTRENRVVRELTCEERMRYNVRGSCEIEEPK